jgi:putative ABC transport system permease protein
VGVAKDFNTRSLRETIEPLVIRLQYDDFPGMSLNLKVKGEFKETMASVKSVYERVLPGYLMDYRLVEDVYENQYLGEGKALNALLVGTCIVLVISAFGIFSLSLFISMKRMKEFGIRKVLGATIRQIAFLHIRYFLRIAIIASAIALPVSYWLTEQWLNGFAYRTESGIIVFLTVTFALIFMIILTAAYSTLKASRMNPVDAIKLE